MDKIKKKVCMLLALGLLFGTVETVNAATYWDYGCKSRSISVKSYSGSYNDTWVKIIDNGRSAWNNSSAGTNISTSSSSSNSVQAAQFNDTWYGQFVPNTVSGSYVTKFTIQVNAKTISDTATNFNNFAKSTVAHEFGHAYFLDDNPPTTRASLMNHSRDRNYLTTPQSFDVENVKAKYE